jgi:hypothetical protein
MSYTSFSFNHQQVVTNRFIHVPAKIILDAIPIKVDLPKVTYCAFGKTIFYMAALRSTHIKSLQLCQLQIMEKANTDPPQQIEAKDNTMLTAASQVALDLQIFNI